MKNTLHRLAASLCIAASLSAQLGAQAADAYPSKPITLIVPWNAGGAVDLVGRKVTELMNRNGGVNVVIENIAGASSLIGLAKVARAAPDGYTFGIATPSLMGAIAQRTTPLRLENFTIMNQVGIDQLMLAVPKSSPANNVEEFVKLMQTKPGGVSIGVPGRNNINHIFAAMLAKATNTQYTNVSYTGGSKVLIDLAGNHIDAGVVKPSETIGQVKAGLVKAIGVFSNTRVEAMPDLPTFAERKVDVFPYGDVEQVTFLVGPKGVPADRLARAQELFAQVLGSAEYRKFAVDHGMTVTDLSGAKMEKVVRDVQRTFDTVAPKIFTKVVE